MPPRPPSASGSEPHQRGFCLHWRLNVRPFGKKDALARGFSLVEVVLALGVISFALIGIMGLFPVALKSAEESRRETRATLIAQQIFSDLRSGSGSNRPLGRGASLADGPGLITAVSLAQATNAVIAFDASGQGLTNSIASVATPVPGAVFLATVSVDTNTGTTNLSRVQATIETPAEAPWTNRTRFTFVTLMGY